MQEYDAIKVNIFDVSLKRIKSKASVTQISLRD